MKPYWVLLAGMLVPWAASADITQPLRFSGFGTVGAAFNDDEGGDYTANYEELEGAGRTHGKDYGVDSVFGVQADMEMAPALQATVQMQSRRVADGSSTPYFEWANVKYRFNEDLSVRVGRVVAPMFMVSESRAVGYAHTALRLAPDVYLLNPVSYLDGGGVTYQFDINNVIYSANATAGYLKKDLPSFFGEINLKFDTGVVNLTAETGGSTYRLGFGKARIDFVNDALDLLDGVLDTLVDAGIANAAKVQSNLVYQDFQTHFLDAGYQYDRGPYLVQAEYVTRRSDSFLIYDMNAYALLGGYRLGKWTPFLRYSQADCINAKSKLPALEDATLSSPLSAYADTINEFTTSLKVYDERKTWTLGTRWDIADNYALKFQYDRISKPAGQAGLFINTTAEFEAESRAVDVYAVALDFIF